MATEKGIVSALALSLMFLFISLQLTLGQSTSKNECESEKNNSLNGLCVNADKTGSCLQTTSPTPDKVTIIAPTTSFSTASNISAAVSTIATMSTTAPMSTTRSNLSCPVQNPGMYHSHTDTACIISVSFLATALIVTVVALVVTVFIVLTRSDIKRKVTYDLQPKNSQDERNAQTESTHEDLERLPSVRIIIDSEDHT